MDKKLSPTSESPGSAKLFVRLLRSTGLVAPERLDELIAGDRPSLAGIKNTLLTEKLLSQEQCDSLELLSLRPNENSSLSDPLMIQLGFLKSMAGEGKIIEALEILGKLRENPAYARLGVLVLKNACLKDPDQQEQLRLLEAKIVASEEKAARITVMDSKPSHSGGAFQYFVELKKAVSTGDLQECMRLERLIRDDETYGRAAFKLVQKAFLNKALVEHRKSDLEMTVVKCKSCQTAYAIDKGDKKGCVLCGEVISS